MKELNPKLIAELARLAARYPPEDWQRLLDSFEDERQRTQVIHLLRELAQTSKARSQTSRSAGRGHSPAKRLREALSRIRVVDPGRAALLEETWLKLRQREILPDMRTVRVFAEAMGLKGLASTRRDQAVNELMEGLVDMPRDALEGVMRQTMIQDRQLGEEYERWVRLILDQRSPNKDD